MRGPLPCLHPFHFQVRVRCPPVCSHRPLSAPAILSASAEVAIPPGSKLFGARECISSFLLALNIWTVPKHSVATQMFVEWLKVSNRTRICQQLNRPDPVQWNFLKKLSIVTILTFSTCSPLNHSQGASTHSPSHVTVVASLLNYQQHKPPCWDSVPGLRDKFPPSSLAVPSQSPLSDPASLRGGSTLGATGFHSEPSPPTTVANAIKHHYTDVKVKRQGLWTAQSGVRFAQCGRLGYPPSSQRLLIQIVQRTLPLWFRGICNLSLHVTIDSTALHTLNEGQMLHEKLNENVSQHTSGISALYQLK